MYPNLPTESQKYACIHVISEKRESHSRCCFAKNIVTCLRIFCHEFDAKAWEGLDNFFVGGRGTGKLIWPRKCDFEDGEFWTKNPQTRNVFFAQPH